MNSVNMTGRLTADPELRQTTSGISVCRFSLAVLRPKTKDVTDFFECVAWRQTSEFISRYFHKGDAIGITGCLVTRKFEDKSHVKRTVVEITVDDVSFVTGKNNGTTDDAQKSDYVPYAYTSKQTEPKFEEVPADDSLPF